MDIDSKSEKFGYCPRCGDREDTSFFRSQCGCGLYWSAARHSFPHYYVRLDDKQAEALQVRLCRKVNNR